MGTIAAYAVTGGNKHALVLAQSTGKGQSTGQAALPVRRFDIPDGPLDLVLAQFSKISGMTIRYTVPTETVPGFKSHGVSGLYSEPQALRMILAGTGLDFKIAGHSNVAIGVTNSESVQVTASNIDSIGLSKFPAPLLDTPQSVTAIPAQLLADRGCLHAARYAAQFSRHQSRGR